MMSKKEPKPKAISKHETEKRAVFLDGFKKGHHHALTSIHELVKSGLASHKGKKK